MARLDHMTPRLAALGNDPGIAIEGPRASVAAIIRDLPGSESAELFFIRRAEHPQDPWSGHVAFPGGRRDPEDTSLVATAIRETLEEVGIALRPEQLVARLPDVPAFSRSKKGSLVVTPFVFAMREDPRVAHNVEVATSLWVPVTTLLRGEGKSSFKLDYAGQTYDMPCIYLEPGAHKLWGMTYRMLETLLDAIR
jgi:8-oxo-dGTP pyrophosphatase MutT (NUDIX family)